MTKKGLLQSLKKIKGILNSDSANEAIEVLKKEIESLPEEVKEQTGFPLPTNINIQDEDYLVFSDGACRGNPGPGAWGAMAQDSQGEVIFESSGVSTQTTNNRMELEGAIEGLKSILERIHEESKKPSDLNVFLFSDSKYVIDGLKKWVPGWKKRGWKKGDGKTPENVEMWQELEALGAKFPSLELIWVKGHAGHPQNEHCDLLANNALDEAGF